MITFAGFLVITVIIMCAIENYQSPSAEIIRVDTPAILCLSPGNGIIESTMQGVGREEFEW